VENAMPEELRSSILEAKVRQYGFSGLNAKLFVPSIKQLTGETTNDDGAHVPNLQYKYFADGNTRNRSKLGNSQPERYWVANNHSNGTTNGKNYRRLLTYDGTSIYQVYSIYGTENTTTAGLLLGFCIGVADS
jgi:hypothetical protein